MITETPMTADERRSVSALAGLYCFRMLGLFMVLPLLALYAADLPGANPAMIGLALGVYGLMQALLQVPLGWLSDKVGRKPVIIGGLLLFALGSVVAALASSIEWIVLGRVLQGAGAIASTVMAMVADLTREEQRTKAMALVGASIGFSFILALVVGPLIASIADLAGVFWFTAFLAIIGVALVIWVVPTPSGAGVAAPASGVQFAELMRSLRDGVLLRFNIGVFVLHFVLTAIFLVVPGLLENAFAVDRVNHWLVYLPVLLTSLLGMLPLMVLAERKGRLRWALLIAIALVFVASLVLGLVPDSAIFYGGMWLFFVGFNYLEATLPAQVSKSVGVNGRGAAMGVYSTCQFMGAFAGGAGGGWLLQYAGLQWLMGACLGLVLVWGLIVFLAGPEGPRNVTPVAAL